MKILQSFLICFVLVLQNSIAHELPLSIVYPNKQMVVAASFSLTGAEIEQAYNGNSQYFDYAAWAADKSASNADQIAHECGKITNARTCGQVDQFFQAATVGMLTCSSFALIQKTQYAGELVPRFTAPASFINGNTAAPDHHSSYDLSQGIAFDCVYPVARPSGSADRRDTQER